MLDFFRSTGPSAIEEVERLLVQMLRDGRAVYDAATAAVAASPKRPNGRSKRPTGGSTRHSATSAAHSWCTPR